jgi:hypothetical protein
MSRRPALPKRVEKAVFQQFDSRCPFCEESDISALQVHHIEPYAEVKAHAIENLILVCANCHGRIDAGEIPLAAVCRAKAKAASGSPPSRRPRGDTIILDHSHNNGIVANQVTIKTPTRRGVAAPAPSGTIASDRDSRNYVKYLIDRYHTFKRAEIGADAMRHAVFYAAIKRSFGAKWDHVPLERCDELAAFIQGRIDKTVLGRNKKADGLPRYRSFEAYLEKYGP